VNILTTLKVKYFYADKSEFIPLVHKGMPYRNPSPSDQVIGFLSLKGGPFH